MQKRIFTGIFQYGCLVVLAVLSAFNYEIFIRPNGFAPSGINGLATMVQYLLDFSIGYMSLLINVPMLLVAVFIINRKYATRTLTYVVVFAVSLLILQSIDISAIAFHAKDGGGAIMAAVAGGFFNGTIFSLTIRLGGSTGGTDIIALFIHNKRPEYNTVWIIFTLNTVVAICSFFVYDFSYQAVILCIIYCFVAGRVSDGIFKGARSALRFEVVTTQPEELAQELMSKLGHGCTVVPAKGMYSHHDQSILICVVNPRQTVEFENILKKYDHTFATVTGVSSTFGNFKRIK